MYSETPMVWSTAGQNPAIGTSTSTIHSDDCTLFYKMLGVKLSHVMYIPSGNNPADPLSPEGYIPPQVAFFQTP
jgi:hypothetical protein